MRMICDLTAKNSNKVVRRNSGNSPARQLRNRQLGAQKLPAVKGLQPGDSIPVILVVVRQVGSMENRFFGLGNRKAVGRS